MSKPISIRTWATWPSDCSVPVGHAPLIPPSYRDPNGLSRPVCIGHRAARGLAPENTLSAVRAALAAGVDWIEVDVWYVDGELVVIHDQRVERTTNGVGYVQDYSLHDLRMLDAGDCQRVPLLEEVIALVDGRCGINIELKGPDCAEAAVDAVHAALRSGRWSVEQFIVSSFDHEQLRRVQQLDDSIRRGLLLCGAPYNLAEYVQVLGVYSVHFSADFLRPEWIEVVHAQNVWAFAYTVNDKADIERLRSWGVDGFFTDYPERVLSSAELAAMPKVA